MGQSKLLSKALCLSSSSALASLASVVWFLWGQSSHPVFLAGSGTGPARIRAGGAAQADRAIPRPTTAPGKDHVPAETPPGGPRPHPGRALQGVHGTWRVKR